VRVLIVDDSKVMRMIVVRALRQAGTGPVEVAEASDGIEALAAVESFAPDLILSDWNMPNMSGLDLLKALRAGGCETTFGFVTSETHPALREEATGAGATFLLTKPFSPEQVADVLMAVKR
jgi:two-component system chemotaxis response regulator CheY